MSSSLPIWLRLALWLVAAAFLLGLFLTLYLTRRAGRNRRGFDVLPPPPSSPVDRPPDSRPQ